MFTQRRMLICAVVLVIIGALGCRNSGREDFEQKLEQIEKRTTRLTEAVRALSDAAEELGKLVPEMRLAVIDMTLMRTGMMLTPLISSPGRAGQTAMVIGPVERSSDERGVITEVGCRVVFAGFSQADTDTLSREELTAICTAILSSFKAGYLVYFPDDAGASFQLNLFFMNSAQGPIQFGSYSIGKGLIRK
jgi:hypothetical protein